MDVEIYFVGGTSTTWTGVPKETVNSLVCWLDNKDNTTTYRANFINHKKITYLRKELVLFLNVIG
jgi:hypothetical protein